MTWNTTTQTARPRGCCSRRYARSRRCGARPPDSLPAQDTVSLPTAPLMRAEALEFAFKLTQRPSSNLSPQRNCGLTAIGARNPIASGECNHASYRTVRGGKAHRQGQGYNPPGNGFWQAVVRHWPGWDAPD